MEIYILDSVYRRQWVVDDFVSLIWTERFRAYGDFEMIIDSSLENRQNFVSGVKLALNESYRVMLVETVEDSTDDEGRRLLKVRGRSLEAILEERLARESMSDLTANPKWVITDAPMTIARKLFRDICILGLLHESDYIPLVSEGSNIFPDGTIPEPAEIVTYEIEPMTLYSAITSISELYLFGFRLIRNRDIGNLFFDVYMGSDRTTQQTVLPAVVFSESLDSLQNTTQLSSIANYKNVAYVLSPVGSAVVYPDDVNPSVEGFQRRVLLVKADDITDPDPPTASAQMIQRGKEELAKYRQFFGFDGEINQNSQYVYGRDYNLGDLTEFQTTDGPLNIMQVTEQIFVSDSEGDRSYPTLQVNRTVGPYITWADVLDDFATWQDVLAAHPTWLSLLGASPIYAWTNVLDDFATWTDLMAAHQTWQSLIDNG